MRWMAGNIVSTLFVILVTTVNAYALNDYLTSFSNTYPNAKGTLIDTCTICHSSLSTYARNRYGTAYAGAGHVFAPIEAADSDGDGFTNIAEISALTFPGDPASKPVITNSPPLANAGPDQIVNEGAMVTLNGSNSSDPDGTIVSYEWTQTGGTPVTLSGSTVAQPTFSTPDVAPSGASLTFQLRVTDNGGLQATDTCIVNVAWVNAPPTADAGLDQTVNEGVTVILNGSNSSDPDGTIASYLWTQTGGLPVTLSDPSVVSPTFVSPSVALGGTALIFMLTVTDGPGQVATDTCYVNVTRDNLPPSADAGLDQTVNEGVTVILNGSTSSDPDGTIASYLWTQTGGSPVTLSDPSVAQPTFVAPNVGLGGNSLTFQLTVTDDAGLKGTASTTVNITWLNEPPFADAGPSQAVMEGVTVTLDGSGSIDPDDGIASYLWSQTAGPAVTLSNASSLQPTFVTPVVDVGGATLAFTLTVIDNGGLRSSSQVSVGVNDNGIMGFPADVLTTLTFASAPFGVKENNGGSFTRLANIDPATMPAGAGRPQDMFFGLVDMEIKVASPGATTTVTIYLPAPVPAGYTWYKYTAAGGWADYSGYAVFNSNRDQVTLTLTDGGVGDDDGVVNGVIVDPSGAGAAPLSSSSPSPATAGDSGGGGCFIASVASETMR